MTNLRKVKVVIHVVYAELNGKEEALNGRN
jgi:hypothetical protein